MSIPLRDRGKGSVVDWKRLQRSSGILITLCLCAHYIDTYTLCKIPELHKQNLCYLCMQVCTSIWKVPTSSNRTSFSVGRMEHSEMSCRTHCQLCVISPGHWIIASNARSRPFPLPLPPPVFSYKCTHFLSLSLKSCYIKKKQSSNYKL